MPDINLRIVQSKGGAVRAVEVLDPVPPGEPRQDDTITNMRFKLDRKGRVLAFETLDTERHKGPLQTPGQQAIEAGATALPDPPVDEEPDRLFQSPQQIEDNAAKEGRRWRRELTAMLEEEGFGVTKWTPDRATLVALLTGFEAPMYVEGKRVQLVVPVTATELNQRRPGGGWALNTERLEAYRAAAGLARLPLVFCFSDGQACHVDELYHAAQNGHGAGGNFLVVPRGKFHPRRKVLS